MILGYNRALYGRLYRSGRGALNIDGCRTPWGSDAERLSALPRSMPGANPSLGTFETRDRSHEDPEAFQSPLGRWPTNVVIVHHPDCSEACVEACVVSRLDRRSSGASRYFPQFRSYPEAFEWLARLVQPMTRED